MACTLRAALCLWWAKGGGDAEINTLGALIGILWRVGEADREGQCDKAHVSQSSHETCHILHCVHTFPHLPRPSSLAWLHASTFTYVDGCAHWLKTAGSHFLTHCTLFLPPVYLQVPSGDSHDSGPATILCFR